jgi:hypothetical protein
LAQGGFLFDYSHDYTRSVTIADARSCGYAPFAAVFDGEVAGSIVNHDGTPAEGMAVEIFPSTIDPRRDDSFYGPTASADNHGAYRFDHLPPGGYIVGINLRDNLGPVPATPYRQPGDDGPSIIELGAETHVDVGVLRLPPPSAKRQIAGTVRWSDGRPLGRVRVEVFEDRPGILGSISRMANVGADGEFSTELFEGRTYIVKAEAADAPRLVEQVDRRADPVDCCNGDHHQTGWRSQRSPAGACSGSRSPLTYPHSRCFFNRRRNFQAPAASRTSGSTAPVRPRHARKGTSISSS